MNCTHPKDRQRFGITQQPREIPDVFTGLWPEMYVFCCDCGETHSETWVNVDSMTSSQIFTLLMQMDVVVK